MFDISMFDVFFVTFCLVFGLGLGYFIGNRGFNVPLNLLGSIFLFVSEAIDAISDDGKFSKEEKEQIIIRGQAIIYCISNLDAWRKSSSSDVSLK